MSPRLTVIAGLSAALVLFALFAVFTVSSFRSVAGEVEKAIAFEPVTLARVAEPLQAPLVIPEVEEPTATARVAESTPSDTEPAAVETVETPTDPWAEVFAGTAIAPSDYQAVRDFLFLGDGWNESALARCGCARFQNPYSPDTNRLRIIHMWVVNHHETWAKAAESYRTSGHW